MKFYMKYIYPIIVYFILNHKQINKCRKEMLKNVDGKILEIGFGSGQNLKYYPDNIEEIDAIDKNDIIKIKSNRIEVNLNLIDASTLPFKDNTYDYVISCFTLCSIKDINSAIKEIKRVLKQGGKFIFLEHGKSPDKNVLSRQNKYNKYFIKYGDGCHLNRDIEGIIKEVFSTVDINKFYCNNMPKHVSYIYNGKSIK